MGIIYSVLNVGAGLRARWESSALKTLASTGISAVANLLQTAFNSTQLKSQQQQPKDAGIATYAQLEASLLLAFEQMEVELATIEELVLTDWRKLQIFYGMCLQPSGLDSLFWPSKATPAQARKMLPGYIEQVLEALVPTSSNDWIDSYSFNTGTATPGLSVDLGSSTPMTYITGEHAGRDPIRTAARSTPTTNTRPAGRRRLAQYFLESQANLEQFLPRHRWLADPLQGAEGHQRPVHGPDPERHEPAERSALAAASTARDRRAVAELFRRVFRPDRALRRRPGRCRRQAER